MLARLRRFIEDLGDDESSFSKTVKGLRNGARIAQDVSWFYNDVAQWFGLPQVPRPFLGKEKAGK